MNALVDTTVWSLALRRNQDDLNATEKTAVAELNDLVKEGRSRIIGPVRQELLSGIKNISQYEKIRSALRAFRDELIETPDYEAAARANNDCRAKGVGVTSVDILICAVASRRQWAIFSTDPDFERYASILPINLHKPRK
jgi:predicted nucleic acid-binding protein